MVQWGVVVAAAGEMKLLYVPSLRRLMVGECISDGVMEGAL